jgi:hypothetical protein
MGTLKMSLEMWTKLDNRNSLVSNGTQYRNMQTWQRKCALCSVEFIAHTPGSAPPDKAPTVTTCEEHRGAPQAIKYGWLAWDGKNVAPGPRMKIGAMGATSNDAELEAVKKELSEYGQTIMDTMAANQALRKENDGLKAELAKYTLQGRMEAITKKLPWEH